jgi:CheY-like chemotaxis protein
MAGPHSAAHDVSTGRRALLHGVHVLVVDDDEDPRELFRDVLELAGARVSVAASARAALAAIERDVPDIVVSDIMMPNEDGYWLIDAVRAFRGVTGRRHPRALALTGDGRRHSRARTLAAGFDAQLSKPIGVDTLCEAVARLAGRY